MHTYAAIDLHSNNGVLAVIDENDKVLRRKKLPNKLAAFVDEFEPFRSSLQGVAVESTFNWYWLVDGLQQHEFPAVLVNTAAIQQYTGAGLGTELLFSAPRLVSVPAFRSGLTSGWKPVKAGARG